MEQYEIHIVRGEGLVAKDRTVLNEVLHSLGQSSGTEMTSSDPFVSVVCNRATVGMTQVAWKSLDPVWNERFLLPVDANERGSRRDHSVRHFSMPRVCLVVKDKDWMSEDDDMGVAWLDLNHMELSYRSYFRYAWLKVEPTQACKDASGRLLIGARVLGGGGRGGEPLSPGGCTLSPGTCPMSPGGITPPRVLATKGHSHSRLAIGNIEQIYAKYEEQASGEAKAELVEESTDHDAQEVDDDEVAVRSLDTSALGRAFDEADQNQDGLISFAEFRALIDKVDAKRVEGQPLSENKLREIFDEYDADGSGCVDFAELLRHFSPKARARGRLGNDEGWPRSIGGTLKFATAVVASDVSWIFATDSTLPASSSSCLVGCSPFGGGFDEAYFRVGSHCPASTLADDEVWRRYSLRWWDDTYAYRAGAPPRGSISLHWREVDIVSPQIDDTEASFRLHIATASPPGSLVLDFENRDTLAAWWRCLSAIEARTLSLHGEALEPDSRAVVLDPYLTNPAERRRDDSTGPSSFLEAFFYGSKSTPHDENCSRSERASSTQTRSTPPSSAFKKTQCLWSPGSDVAASSLDDDEEEAQSTDVASGDVDDRSWLVLESVRSMRRRLVNAIIRPDRKLYCIGDLGPRVFEYDTPIGEQATVTRADFDVTSKRGLSIKASHWVLEKNGKSSCGPCILYVHGNGSCRLEALQGPLTVALTVGISLCAIDTSGAGLSEGNFVSLGYHESSDVYDVAEYLKKTGRASLIALWGRSAGAVAALLTVSTKAPLLSAVVADSPFTSLIALAKELVGQHTQKSTFRIPDLFVDLALSWVAGVVRKQADFDITLCDPLATIGCCFVPVLFVHGCDDNFIVPEHSKVLSNACAAKSRLLLCKNSCHNSHRPVDVMTSIARWLQHELCLPATPGLKAYFVKLAKEGRYAKPPWEKV